jgi:cell division protein FtsI/penicillin-binding protein 2
MSILLVILACILVARLVQLQLFQYSRYQSQASIEHTRKYELPARRGELYLTDGKSRSPLALNQHLNLVYADPSHVADKPATAQALAGVLGGRSSDYLNRLGKGIEYTVLAERITGDVADKVKALNLKGVGIEARDYRTYPEGSLAAQTIGFVNSDGVGQYGIEEYLNDELAGRSGQLAAKTDPNGIPIATADNIIKPVTDGKSYQLTIDRNVQAMMEQQIADQVKKVSAKSGSAVLVDPSTGAVIAMATYPTYDPNQYGKVTDYSLFVNQVVANQFEPGSGMKAFTMATGLDQGKITPDTLYDDPGSVKIGDRILSNAVGDKPGKNKSMTVVLRDSLNTGVIFVLRALGGDPDKITLTGKKILYDYFTKHFGFGQRTGIEQANEAQGVMYAPNTPEGNDVVYASSAFGQGLSVTMIQMVTGMAAIANGGKLYQPHIVAGLINDDGTLNATAPKLLRDHVISPKAAADLNGMLQVVAQHGSGYLAGQMNPGYKIAGKTGTAQIPRPDGQGYIDGQNIGSFVGFAPADNPKFVLMVRIDQPGVGGYAETTTVPVFGNICKWLFKYYGIAPTS